MLLPISVTYFAVSNRSSQLSPGRTIPQEVVMNMFFQVHVCPSQKFLSQVFAEFPLFVLVKLRYRSQDQNLSTGVFSRIDPDSSFHPLLKEQSRPKVASHLFTLKTHKIQTPWWIRQQLFCHVWNQPEATTKLSWRFSAHWEHWHCAAFGCRRSSIRCTPGEFTHNRRRASSPQQKPSPIYSGGPVR